MFVMVLLATVTNIKSLLYVCVYRYCIKSARCCLMVAEYRVIILRTVSIAFCVLKGGGIVRVAK
jgi:hypothetical protein